MTIALTRCEAEAVELVAEGLCIQNLGYPSHSLELVGVNDNDEVFEPVMDREHCPLPDCYRLWWHPGQGWAVGQRHGRGPRRSPHDLNLRPSARPPLMGIAWCGGSTRRPPADAIAPPHFIDIDLSIELLTGDYIPIYYVGTFDPHRSERFSADSSFEI